MQGLWIEKYRPQTLDEVGTPEARTIQSLIDFNRTIPNLLFNGVCGAGKKTLIMAMLRQLYGPDVWHRRMEYRTMGAGENTELNVISSKYHMEITPTDVGAHDCDVVQNIIKETAQSQSLSVVEDHAVKFKVVVLNDADRLSKDAQHGLRRTMERYQRSCRIVLVAENAAYLIEPLRSRCLLIRVPQIPHEVMHQSLTRIAEREGLGPEAVQTAMTVADGNMRTAVMTLQAALVDHKRIEAAMQDWKIFMDVNFVERISEVRASGDSFSMADLQTFRSKLYEILNSCVCPDVIFSYLTLGFVLAFQDRPQMVEEVVRYACRYQQSYSQGNKDIFHLEAFVFQTCRLVSKDSKKMACTK